MPSGQIVTSMRKSSILFSIVYFSVLSVCAQQPGFVAKNPFPGGGRDDAAAFVIGNKAYVGTGLKTGWINAVDFWAYDAGTDTWEQRADLPGPPRQYASVFSLNGFGYLTCGIGAGNMRFKDTWKYDPGNDTWTALLDFPDTAREGVQTAVYNNRAYLFFGQKITGTFFKQVWKFDGNTESWTRLPDFPSSPRYLSAHAQTDSAVYFVSGYDSTGQLTPEVWKFNLSAETWVQLPHFPGLPRWYGKGLAFDGKLYFGTGWNHVFLNDFWVFDPQTETWAQALPIPGLGRKGCVTFTVQNRAFVALGVDVQGTRTDEVWELVNNAGITEQAAGTAFTLFPNPVQAEFFVRRGDETAAPVFSFKILDMAGRVLRQENRQAWEQPVNVSSLTGGVYLLQLSAGGKTQVQRFNVQK